MYTRTVELSSLGASQWHPAMNNASAFEHVLALVNASDPFPEVPSGPNHYVAYEKNSVCFVEPMVRDFTYNRSGRPSPHHHHHRMTKHRVLQLYPGPMPRNLSPPPLPVDRTNPHPPSLLIRSKSQQASHGAEAIMFIFIAGVVLGAVPQYLKLILLANSEGISLSSLALMNVSNVTATLNIFILHFEQIKRCVTQEAGYTADICQASLLTFEYTLVYTLLWFPLYPLAAHFCSAKKVQHCGYVASGRQHANRGLLAHLVPCLILAAPVVRMVVNAKDGCAGFEAYAMLLGVMNAILEATRYLPQVWSSWHSHGSGALSYLRLLLSIGGGVGATVQKAMMHEDISTWFPPLVGHSLEVVIVAINLWHDVRDKRERESRGGSEFGSAFGSEAGDLEGGRGTAGSETTPLIQPPEAMKIAAVNAAMERGERGGDDTRGKGGGKKQDRDGEKNAHEKERKQTESDAESDWLDDLPNEEGAWRQSEYVFDQLCTNPKFLNALLKYM